MSVKVSFYHPDVKRVCDIQIPDGLKDRQALKEWIWGYQMSRRAKRSAYKEARRLYKAYNPKFYDEVNSHEHVADDDG